MGYLHGCTDIERPASLRDAGLRSDTAKRRRFNIISARMTNVSHGGCCSKGYRKIIL